MNTFSGQKSEEGNNRRTDIFVNMLKMAQTEEEITQLLKLGSNEKFKTYKQE